jgi:hypothetical protein
MGGGGGGVFSSHSPDKYKEKIKEAREKTRKEAVETLVAEIINKLLADYNRRDVEAIREHLEEIKEIIKDEDVGTIQLLFGGSVSKHTYLNGLSDVDVLMTIDKSDLSELPPKKVLEYVSSILKERLVDAQDIKVGNLAVKVVFSDGIMIEILPAIKHGEGFMISTEKGNEWSNIIRPDKFATRLTEVNQSCNGKVVPVIKLAKGIIAQFPENQQLTGYHVESIAIEAFKRYPESKPKTTKAMLTYFFKRATEIVKTPIRDKTSQSIHVDDYLGPENSPERSKINNNLNRTYERMKNADASTSVGEWSAILEE